MKEREKKKKIIIVQSGGRSKRLRSLSKTKKVITVCGPSLTYCAVHPFRRAVGPSARTRSRATDQGEGEKEKEEEEGAVDVVAVAAVVVRRPTCDAPVLLSPPPTETIILVLTTSMGAVHVVVTRPVAAEAAKCVAVPSPAPVSSRQALFAESYTAHCEAV